MIAGHRALASGLALVLLLALGDRAYGEPENGSVLVKTESVVSEGRALLAVSASVKGASVYVNRRFVGKVPFASGYLEPGNYRIEVEAAGYRSLDHFMTLAEKTKYSLHFKLALVTGYLRFSVQPADAEILVDGNRILDGIAELPVGRHEVTVRRFGHVTRSAAALVLDGATTDVELALSPAAFSVGAPGPSRAAFNPANAGALGRTTIAFSATNYGSARLEIRDPAGKLVAAADYPSMDTWEHSFSWKGRSPGGAVLPDGAYSIELFAIPAPGVPILATGPGIGPEGSVSARSSVKIDSSIIIRAAGSIAAMPGCLLFPDPRPQPAGTIAAEFAWLVRTENVAESAFSFGSSLSLSGAAVLGFGAAAETMSDPAADLAVSLLLSLGKRGSLAVASLFRASWSSAAEPLFPGSSPGAEISLPLSFEFGDFRFGASPGILVDLAQADFAAAPIARAGAWMARPLFRAGASGELAFGGSAGFFAPTWPALACAEARLILAPSPLVASGYILGAFAPGEAPSLTLGLGLGFML